jgi:hypothetical protein
MKKFLLVLFTSIAAIQATAQWSWNSDPTVNNSFSSASVTTQKTGLVAAPDGSGGMFVAWEDARTAATGTDIYIQRIDAGGNLKFDPNGLAVCTATGSQTNIAITDDGAGGVILTWQDARAGNNDIYAQKVSAIGALVWAENGAPIIATSCQSNKPFDNKGKCNRNSCSMER